jgi:hypothetical protein
VAELRTARRRRRWGPRGAGGVAGRIPQPDRQRPPAGFARRHAAPGAPHRPGGGRGPGAADGRRARPAARGLPRPVEHGLIIVSHAIAPSNCCARFALAGRMPNMDFVMTILTPLGCEPPPPPIDAPMLHTAASRLSGRGCATAPSLSPRRCALATRSAPRPPAAVVARGDSSAPAAAAGRCLARKSGGRATARTTTAWCESIACLCLNADQRASLIGTRRSYAGEHPAASGRPALSWRRATTAGERTPRPPRCACRGACAQYPYPESWVWGTFTQTVSQSSRPWTRIQGLASREGERSANAATRPRAAMKDPPLMKGAAQPPRS